MNMIDQAARGAYERHRERSNALLKQNFYPEKDMMLGWEGLFDDTKSNWRSTVRDVITAIRDPSDAMIEAGEYASYSPEEMPAVWRAMIDAALLENSEKM